MSAGLQYLAKPNDMCAATAMTQEKHPESSIDLCQTKLSEFEAREKLRDAELKVFVGGLPYSMEDNVPRTDFEECGALEFDGDEYGSSNIKVNLANVKGDGKGRGKDKG